MMHRVLKPIERLTHSLANENPRGAIAHAAMLTVVFTLCHTFKALYTSNQTTKFLHGLARAGLGNLRDDWLANTIDPLPVFSTLVQWSYTLFTENSFYVYTVLCFGVYIYSLVNIAAYTLKVNQSLLSYLAYLALLLFPHTIQFDIFGDPLFQVFHYGLASQYALGPYFQPSMLGGVLLLWAVHSALRHRPFRAIFAIAIAATVHPAYLPSAAFLTLAIMVLTYRDRRDWMLPLGLGALSFVGVLPVTLYMTRTFTPTTDELFARSQDILVNFRIPHHSLPEIWLTPFALVQIALMLYAVYVVRKERLFYLMAIPMGIAALLTLVQVILGNDTLAFTAPWRVSAILMPLALTVLCAHGVNWAMDRYQTWIQLRRDRLVKLCGGAIALMMFGGSIHQISELSSVPDTRALVEFAQQHRQPGQTYLVPVQIERYWRQDEFWDFRLTTGIPIYINFKSHPYKDVEVIEWHRRVEMADRFYQSSGRRRCRVLNEILERDSITNVVLSDGKTDLTCDGLVNVYTDENYTVYERVP